YTDLYRPGAQKELRNFLAGIGNVKLSRTKITMKAGRRIRLKSSVWPSRLREAICYKSANSKIASVSKGGKITAKKAGKVRIYVCYGKKKKSCYVTVKKKK
ncbi:MAG: Ig-like domain-containing protein, partial [Eubacterium sp.]|nr:Ig-like domain-containing protein [Eubacterium sp.]